MEFGTIKHQNLEETRICSSKQRCAHTVSYGPVNQGVWSLVQDPVGSHASAGVQDHVQGSHQKTCKSPEKHFSLGKKKVPVAVKWVLSKERRESAKTSCDKSVNTQNVPYFSAAHARMTVTSGMEGN